MSVIGTSGEWFQLGGNPPLTPDMKAVLALEVIFVIFVAVISSPLPTGSVNPFAVAWLALTIPYLVLLYFGWRGEGWAFLGSSLISVALIVFIGSNMHGTEAAVRGALTPAEVWTLALALILLSLISLEGFKGYLQSKSAAA
ncbi:MAG: hypothetical protein R3291_05240 [Thermoplasmata archaeon]|nr:hypothetical protein [Thermoplasmata archaeon]